MQPALAALPELPAVGPQAVAAPVRRARRLQQELRTVARRIGTSTVRPEITCDWGEAQAPMRESSGRVWK
jgi:hypothetical protein